MASRATSIAKKQEGDQHMIAADKCVATHFFKWSPDWTGAAMEYNKAATCYRNCKENQLAKDAFIKSANAHTQATLTHGAARAYESAALIAKDSSNRFEAMDLFQKSSNLYSRHGELQKAAEMLFQASTMCDNNTDNERCIELLSEACSLYESADKEYAGVETSRALVSAYIRSRKFTDAVSAIEQQVSVFLRLEQPHNVFKAYKEAFVVILSDRGVTAAEEAFQKYSSDCIEFGASQDALFCTKLLDLIQYGDSEELKKLITREMVTIRTEQIARLLNEFKPLGRSREDDAMFNTKKFSATSTSLSTLTSTSTPPIVNAFGDGSTAENDDDDDDDDPC